VGKARIVMRMHVALAVVFLSLAMGCQRSAIPTPAGGGSRSIDDYRKLTIGELEALIREKLGSHGIHLDSDGPNRYKGAIPSPDGTVMLPLEVTVEAQRIVCVTKTPAGSTTNVITPRGLEAGPVKLTP
jgi:hypothetical protein